MTSLLRLWLSCFTRFYQWLFAILFPFFLFSRRHNGKKLSDRIWDAYDEANVDPIPDEAEEARKARRAARKPGQLADFDQ